MDVVVSAGEVAAAARRALMGERRGHGVVQAGTAGEAEAAPISLRALKDEIAGSLGLTPVEKEQLDTSVMRAAIKEVALSWAELQEDPPEMLFDDEDLDMSPDAILWRKHLADAHAALDDESAAGSSVVHLAYCGLQNNHVAEMSVQFRAIAARLVSLNLSSNKLECTESVPAEMVWDPSWPPPLGLEEWLVGCVSLEKLSLANNAALPALSMCDVLPTTLKELDLSGTSAEGSKMECIDRLTNLVTLDVSATNARLTPSIGRLPALMRLSASGCDVAGLREAGPLLVPRLAALHYLHLGGPTVSEDLARVPYPNRVRLLEEVVMGAGAV